MAVRDLVLRTQELGGQLVTIGGDAARGITIESSGGLQADGWGPSGASFVLKRDPRVQWPDLQAYAPVTVEAQGQLVWRGRIKGTPMTDGGTARQIALNCEGKQFHLDDDVYQRSYVQTDLSAWPDWRSSLTCPLPFATVQGSIVSEGGAVVLGWPKGSTQAVNEQVGVLFDSGPTGAPARWTIVIDTSNNTGNINFELDAVTDAAVSGSSLIISQTILLWGASGGATFTVPSGFRYLLARMICGTSAVLGADVYVRIRTSTVYSSASYESGGVSILKASDVVLDALSRATLLLSADRSLVQATTFNVPEFNMTGPATPREAITAVNAYHGYQFRVRADNRPEYRPLPATPSVQVGEDSRFDEASAGDASEVYSTALVSYTDAAGVPQSISRGQTSALYTPSVIQPTNPGAEANTTGWTAGFGTFTRTTTAGEFSAGIGAFKLVAASGGFLFCDSSAWTGGSFVTGQSYRLTFDWRGNGTPSIFPVAAIYVDGVIVGAAAMTLVDNTYHSGSVDWVQPSTSTPTIRFEASAALGSTLWWDNLLLYEGNATVVNRRGFRRTKVLDTNMSLTPAGAQQIADVFLASHKTTPLKGKLTIPGHGRAIDVPSGSGLSCAELLGRTGDLVRISHLTDPDTGKLGRIGRIAGANYDPATDSVVLDIDSTSTDFESLLARMAIVTGQVRG